MHKISALISVKQLASTVVRGSKNLRVLDASWYLPATKRNPKEEFESTHIPGAQLFDIDDCCDKSSNFDHMLPSPQEFENYVGNLGISNKTHVVVYDTNDDFGIFSAQRVWWTFRVFGHDLVSVLDGGFSRWCSDGQPVTAEKKKYPREIFKAEFRPHLVKAFPDIEKNMTEKNFQLVDARSTGRFQGTAAEPRLGIKPGHIPGSINIPFSEIMDPETKTVKTMDELQKLFKNAGVDLQKPLIATCGSGVTACCIALAAFICGKEDVPIYDGSWLEWYLRSKPEQRRCCPED